MEKKHLSYSAINDYLLCPECYRRSRIERIRTPFSPAGHVGTLAHSVFEVNYRQKIASGNDLPSDELTDRFAELWAKTCDCGHLEGEHAGHCAAFARHRGRLCDCTEYRHAVPLLDWRFDNPDAIHSQAIAAIRAHREHLAPRLQPAVVEQEFRVSLGDDFPYDLLGFLDLITVEHKIIDLKFYSDFAFRKLEREIDNDGQLDLYTIGYRVVRGRWEAGIEIAATNKISGATKIVPAKRKSNEALQWRLKQVQEVGRAIVAQVFPMRDDTWKCSAKWCGHWKDCKGAVSPV